MHLPIDGCVSDPEVLARVRAHVAAPHNLAEHGAARRVLETGEALLVPHFDLEQLRSAATPEVVAAYEAIGIHSLLLVAMRVRGESVGLLALVRFAADSPPFSDHELLVALEACLAVDAA